MEFRDLGLAEAGSLPIRGGGGGGPAGCPSVRSST